MGLEMRRKAGEKGMINTDERITVEGVEILRYTEGCDGTIFDHAAASGPPTRCIRCERWTWLSPYCPRCIADDLKLSNAESEGFDMSAPNGNCLDSIVRLKFRSGTSMRRARDIWDVMVRQYESAAIVKDGRRLFLTIRPPKDDCRYVWMMLLCKDIVGIETNATADRPAKAGERAGL